MIISCIQHRLPSICFLLDKLNFLLLPSKINLFTKYYSKVDFDLPNYLPVSERKSIEDIIEPLEYGSHHLILDEGGLVHNAIELTNISAEIVGVEQTTYGLQKSWKYPCVLVCRSAAKLFFESQIIIRGVLRKLDDISALVGVKKVGVVGCGAIGKELVYALESRGITVLTFDITDSNNSLKYLAKHADIIFGCTGKDCLKNIELSTLTGVKTLISCSSSNVEFKSILDRLPGSMDTYETASGDIGSCFFNVLNGGYPINFDRKVEWEHPDEIVLTRMLMLEGAIQAIKLFDMPANGYMLSPERQYDVVMKWLESVPEKQSIRMPENFSVSWLKENSEGLEVA